MSIETDVQKLEPGPLFTGYTLDASAQGGGLVRFHGHTDSASILWQGNTFDPWPITAEGFARTSDQQPMPKLAVGNLDGSISLLCLLYDDLVGAKLTRHRTFFKYLDGEPGADPDMEFPPEVWFIERKALESREAVELDLSSALNFQGMKLPRRQIIANYCPFAYRGAFCGYVGGPVADEFDVPTSDPLVDRCGKRLASCKLRDWPDDILNFGGFPAAGLVRT